MSVWLRRAAPGSPPLSKRQVLLMAERMLGELGLAESELSIFLTNDAEIHKINSEHRGKDKPTDVLSFPQHQFRAPEKPRGRVELTLLGDVVISLDTAARQARTRRRPLADEVRFLLAHGILHLVGYDHATPDEKKVMTKRTRQLVSSAARASNK
jgi:probable rRNA maturation factor